ncbi:uncharacterized protein LOC117581955 [Drosophila guanche]|uniref:Uncharacterized protein n=1 Tax=Drosophila guanche TaxID=7266 RepID=A0A3B0JGC5_DROGU|nr:uncharacterized protein LOC117581955 [Drosophila guanche]SPP79302.1 Hypothetical predicted protein [Drosophila guanche]
MFHCLSGMCLVTRSLTRGAQRHLSVGTLRWNESKSQKDAPCSEVLPQEETVPAKEASAIVVAGKCEDVGSADNSQSPQAENAYKMNRREAFRRMMKEKSNTDCSEEKPSEQRNSSDYGQLPLRRQAVAGAPQPAYRGPQVKKMDEKKTNKADDAAKAEQEEKVKLNRHYYLRQMCMEKLQRLQEQQPVDGSQKQSLINIKRESLDPARLELLNVKWKEQQQEIAKRMKDADKKKFVSRFEQNAGRKEKIN